MYKFLILIFLGFLFLFTKAEKKTYNLSISDNYNAKVIVDNPKHILPKGTLVISDNTTGKVLVNQKSTAFTLDTDPDDDSTDLPYEMQKIIVFEDVNFDGIPDLIVQDGINIETSAPTYTIYLADGKGGFELNKDFTALAHDYYSLFSVEPVTKHLQTIKKEDDIIGSFYEFEVWKNKPRLIKQIVDKYDTEIPFQNQRTRTIWNEDGTKITIQYSIASMINPGVETMYSIYLKDSNEKVSLLKINDKDLYYVTEEIGEDWEKGDKVTFYYLLRFGDTPQGKLNATYVAGNDGSENIVFISENGVKYELYNSPDKALLLKTKDGITQENEGELLDRRGDSFYEIIRGTETKD